MEMERFSRQNILKDFGSVSQERLLASKVLVIGAGGLGCPILMYLCAVGVGHIGLVDGDTVSLSNLNRQVLFGIEDIGLNKASTVADKLSRQYGDIYFDIFDEFLVPFRALEIFPQYDLIIDATDNFSTRYMINDACVLLGKSFIMGAVFRNEGQLAVFNYPPNDTSVNYRDLYPEPPRMGEVPDCNQAGVLGALTGVIGSMQAAEAIKILSGYGTVTPGQLYCYNMFTQQITSFVLSKNPESVNLIPKNKSAFLSKDYKVECGLINNISWEEIKSSKGKNMLLLDVRESNEQPLYVNNTLNIPLNLLQGRLEELKNHIRIGVFCQTGSRSKQAVQIISRNFPEKEVFNIDGGIFAIKK